MERKIILISDDATLQARLQPLVSEWQLLTSPRLLPDLLLNRDSQLMVILDLNQYLAANAPSIDLGVLRQQFQGLLLGVYRESLPDKTICELLVTYHFDELLALDQSTPVLGARLQQKIWRYFHQQAVIQPSALLEVGPLKIDFQHYAVTIDQRRLNLGPIDFRLLVFFIQNENVVLTRIQIAEGVWRNGKDSTLRSIDSHISKLRKLIERDAKQPQYLQTVRGFGYIFNLAPT